MLANVKRISNYWRISEKMPKSTFLKLSDERKEKLRKTIYNMFIKKDYEIKTEVTNIRLLYVNDGRNYITGNLDVKMITKVRKHI